MAVVRQVGPADRPPATPGVDLDDSRNLPVPIGPVEITAPHGQAVLFIMEVVGRVHHDPAIEVVGPDRDHEVPGEIDISRMDADGLTRLEKYDRVLRAKTPVVMLSGQVQDLDRVPGRVIEVRAHPPLPVDPGPQQDDLLELCLRRGDDLIELLPAPQEAKPRVMKVILPQGARRGRELAVVLARDEKDLRLRQPPDQNGRHHRQGPDDDAPSARSRRRLARREGCRHGLRSTSKSRACSTPVNLLRHRSKRKS